MGRGYLDLLILWLLLSHGVFSIELLANYKYWKSVSDQLTYDYSGNSRHGILNNDYIVTDRGLTPNIEYYFPSLMNYHNPELAKYLKLLGFKYLLWKFWLILWAYSGEVFAKESFDKVSRSYNRINL